MTKLAGAPETLTRQSHRDLDRSRAGHAWEKVRWVDGYYKDDEKKDYRTRSRGLPALVMTAGLAQTLAFLRAKAGGDDATKSVERALYDHVASWWATYQKRAGSTDDWWFLEEVLGAATDRYRQMTGEILAYLGWLKRFAEAVLPAPEAGT